MTNKKKSSVGTTIFLCVGFPEKYDLTYVFYENFINSKVPFVMFRT